MDKLDNDLFNKLLQKISAEENIEQPNITVKTMSTGGANFTSNLYLVTITDKENPNRKDLKLFAKVAAMNASFRETLKEFSVYDTEKLVYTVLFPTYRRLEEKYGFSEEHKLIFAKYYGADSTHLQETMVLEDLGARGFELYSRFKSVDWPYAKAAITELAKFHALSFTCQHKYPIEYKKLLSTFKSTEIPMNEDMDSLSNHMKQLAIDTVDEKNKEKLKNLLENNSVNMSVMLNLTKVVKHAAFIHADFRPSNMLYRRISDDVTEVIPVDYQGTHPGCPAGDFVFFLVCGTDGAFRAQYYRALVDHYHSELGAALARFGLDVNKIYPKDDFEFELKQKLPYGLVFSVMGLLILTTPEDQAPKIEDFDIRTTFQSLPTGDLYRTRLNELVDDCVAWGVLTD